MAAQKKNFFTRRREKETPRPAPPRGATRIVAPGGASRPAPPRGSSKSTAPGETPAPPRDAAKISAPGEASGTAAGDTAGAAVPGGTTCRWVFHLSYARLCMWFILFFLATAWFFVMGFMTGINQNPAETLKKITIFEDSRPNEAPETAETSPDNESPVPADSPRAGEETLTARSAPPDPAAEQLKPQTPPSGNTPAAAGTDGQKNPPAAPERLQGKASAPQKKNQEKPVTSNSPQYKYIFQAATFRATQEDRIAALRRQLKEKGLTTVIHNQGSLRQIRVLFQGSEQDAAHVRRICESLRLGTPILRGRQPVNHGKN